MLLSKGTVASRAQAPPWPRVRDYMPVRRGQDKARTASEQESEQLSERRGQSHGTRGADLQIY